MDKFNKNKFFAVIDNLRLTNSVRGLRFYLNNLFHRIDFKKKNILDIGAGAGVYSCYMSSQGADKVIGLEPEIEGSRNNYIAKFRELGGKLQLNNVFLEPLTFQAFESKGELFDLILLHYSVNHLNEDACIELEKSIKAREEYGKIFDKLYSIANDGADLIMADCSSKNFFNLLGMKNPFAPTIEWHKHQSPENWINLLKKSGFNNFKVKWTAPSQLGKLGDLLLGNKLCSYFTHSHFIIYAKK
jgi:hypothetical protein